VCGAQYILAVTAEAYRQVLNSNNDCPQLHDALHELNPDNVKDLQARDANARAIFAAVVLPQDFQSPRRIILMLHLLVSTTAN